MRITAFLLLLFVFCFPLTGSSQSFEKSLRLRLDSLETEFDGLGETVDFGVNGVSVRDFLRSIAENHNLNFSINNDINDRIINNFTNAKVADILFFICTKHNLDFKLYGSIFSFFKKVEPSPPIKQLEIEYNPLNSFLSINLRNDSIHKVAAAITKKTDANLIYEPELANKSLNIFIKNRPLENALELLAESNGISLEKKSERVFILKQKTQVSRDSKPTQAATQARNKPNKTSFIEVDSMNLISAKVTNIAINDLISEAATKTGNKYFLYSNINGTLSTYINSVNFDEFLAYVFNGSEYTSILDDDVYLIGERTHEILRTTELVKLENRTIESIIDFIPEDLKSGVEIKEFVELNALILSGSRPMIREIKNFLASIDQIVPVIKIDVIIVDVTKNATLNAGIDLSFGSGEENNRSSGTLVPGVNVNLSSNSLNDLINSFNGLGIVNLGKVSSDFVTKIQALEANGLLKLRSTPMLATLNGHEAELKIGNTEYYLELQANTLTSQTPIQTQTQTYKSVTADLQVNIKPIVSNGEDVTLEIEVNQSDFTARIDETAPPGTVDRSFKSNIRIKDGEMILLGGLEEKRKEDSGSGLPFLSRIPVLKWLFSSRTKTSGNTKLNIFIRATVVYG